MVRKHSSIQGSRKPVNKNVYTLKYCEIYHKMRIAGASVVA
jgi:hypothetical protein